MLNRIICLNDKPPEFTGLSNYRQSKLMIMIMENHKYLPYLCQETKLMS